MLKKLLMSIMVVSSVMGESCWNSLEVADIGLSGLDDITKFSIKDVDDCKPVANATVYFLGKKFHTNQSGEISFPSPPEEVDGYIPLKIERDGYITLIQKVPVSFGTVWQKKFLLTKQIPIGSARFILSWGKKPRDLDLHLVSDDFHISYRNKSGALYKARLDRDATKGYGPETITLKKLNNAKTYRVLVHRYSKDGVLDKQVTLSVYKNNQIDNVIHIPNTITSRCVELALIHNNTIHYTIKPVDDAVCTRR